MEQLDLVYKTFTSLEKNYGRSKKTREEYILDKFGGDINVGSFLILNALSAERFTDPEDIRKFSVVREIFQAIKENQHRLNSLTSFNFDEDSATTAITNALDAGQWAGSRIQVCSQSILYSECDALHFEVKPGEAHEVALGEAKYIRLYSKAMALFVQQFATSQVSVGDLVEKKLWNQYDKVESPVF